MPESTWLVITTSQFSTMEEAMEFAMNEESLPTTVNTRVLIDYS
jgi:hypothetical protein